MFVLLYSIFSLFTFLGREHHPGSELPRCAASGCHYDLHGLDASAACPECGCTIRERTPGHHEIVFRPRVLVPWALTFLLLMAVLVIPERPLAFAVRVPLAIRDHFLYRGPVLAPEIDPLYIAVALTPLAARVRKRWLAFAGIILIVIAGYTIAARIAMKL
jgi:hypothetical protein